MNIIIHIPVMPEPARQNCFAKFRTVCFITAQKLALNTDYYCNKWEPCGTVLMVKRHGVTSLIMVSSTKFSTYARQFECVYQTLWCKCHFCFVDVLLQDQPNLRTRLDDAFLLRFLRARKFDYDRALQLLLNYHAGRKAWPEVFQDLKPSTVKHVLDLGFLTVLPQPDPNGRYILCLRPGNSKLLT